VNTAVSRASVALRRIEVLLIAGRIFASTRVCVVFSMGAALGSVAIVSL
jgi:hypothetical protein